jgi:predicted transcriptional regulator
MATDSPADLGLSLLQKQEMIRQAQLDRLRSQINLGLNQAIQGELLDGEEVFEELEKRFAGPDRSR